ncbi:MAG: hypothetical protein JWQ48_176 [Conexibacter sp.]|nr:hypothetical protein [Conexibacter sp.]
MGAVLSVLRDAERAAVLDELVATDASIREAAERAARLRLAHVDVREVAEGGVRAVGRAGGGPDKPWIAAAHWLQRTYGAACAESSVQVGCECSWHRKAVAEPASDQAHRELQMRCEAHDVRGLRVNRLHARPLAEACEMLGLAVEEARCFLRREETVALRCDEARSTPSQFREINWARKGDGVCDQESACLPAACQAVVVL